MATDVYKIVSQYGKGIGTGAAGDANEDRLKTDTNFRESEYDRALKVIADREAAGEDISAQLAYVDRIKKYGLSTPTPTAAPVTTTTKAPVAKGITVGKTTASRPVYNSVPDFADEQEIVYDMDAIRNAFTQSVNAAYDERYKQQDVLDRNYYSALGAQQNTLMDSLYGNKLTAAERGLSRGGRAAEQIALALGLSQQGVDSATELAAGRAAIADSQKTDLAAIEQLALESHNTTGLDIAKILSDKYGYDTSGYAADLGALANVYASDKNLETQMYASDKALEGQIATANSYASGSGSSSYNGSSKSTSDDPLAEYKAIPGFNDLSPDAQQRLILAITTGADYDTISGILQAGGSEAAAIDAAWLARNDAYMSRNGNQTNVTVPGSTTGVNLTDTTVPNMSESAKLTARRNPLNWALVDSSTGTWMNTVTQEYKISGKNPSSLY